VLESFAGQHGQVHALGGGHRRSADRMTSLGRRCSAAAAAVGCSFTEMVNRPQHDDVAFVNAALADDETPGVG